MTCFVRADDGTMVNLERAETLSVVNCSVVAVIGDRPKVLRTCDDNYEAVKYLNEIAARANGGSTPTMVVTQAPTQSRFGKPVVR